jgi:hypothetical protein
MYCFNRMNGCGCNTQCLDDYGQRFPLVDNGKGGKKCTCPVCMCNCQATYKVDSVHDIKIGLMSEQSIYLLGKGLGTSSKLKTSHSLGESEMWVAKKIKFNLDVARKMDSQSQLRSDNCISNAEETAYELAATEVVKDLHLHKAYVSEFRREITPQMTHGKATMIQIEGGEAVDVRILQKSAKIHQYNNQLNASVIKRLDSNESKSKNDVIELDGFDSDDCSMIERADTEKENTYLPISHNKLGVNPFQEEMNTYNNVDGLYNSIQKFCFSKSCSLTESCSDYYKNIYAHLVQGSCVLCKRVCEDALSFEGELTAETGLQYIESFWNAHP